MVKKAGLEYRPLSPEQRSDILEATLARAPERGCLRVFAYGSLMWNPCFEPLVSEPALLRGYERHLCILTVRARGTPECPGLSPALVPGAGVCRGVAYTLNQETLAGDLATLFEREMNTGVYTPTWVEPEIGDGRRSALTFVVNSAHPNYCPRLEVQEMADIIAGARGSFGSCRDYLASMVSELERLGGAEQELKELLRQVDARLGGRPTRCK